MVDPFGSSRHKIARAKEHIRDLDGEIRIFSDNDPYERNH